MGYDAPKYTPWMLLIIILIILIVTNGVFQKLSELDVSVHSLHDSFKPMD